MQIQQILKHLVIASLCLAAIIASYVLMPSVFLSSTPSSAITSSPSSSSEIYANSNTPPPLRLTGRRLASVAPPPNQSSLHLDSFFNATASRLSTLRRMHSAYRHLQPLLAANLKMASATNASLIFGDFPIPVPFPPSSSALPSIPLLPHCRTLFTVASGRSGTGWMASLLGKFPFIEIEHEPASSPCGTQIQKLLRVEPKMGFFGSYPARIKSVFGKFNPSNQRPCAPCFEAACKIFGGDSNQMKKGKEKPLIYAQSSHLFYKGYHDIAVAQLVVHGGCHMTIVLLRRFLLDVLASFVRLNFPEIVSNGWCYTLRDRGMALLPWLPPPPEDTRIDLPLWDAIGYVVDVEMQFTYLQQLNARHPLVEFMEISFEDHLLTRHGLSLFFNHLGLPIDNTTTHRIGTLINAMPVNTKREEKPKSPSTSELNDSEIISTLAIWIETYTNKGIVLPATMLFSFIPSAHWPHRTDHHEEDRWLNEDGWRDEGRWYDKEL